MHSGVADCNDKAQANNWEEVKTEERRALGLA